jgi:hypothetical protein
MSQSIAPVVSAVMSRRACCIGRGLSVRLHPRASALRQRQNSAKPRNNGLGTKIPLQVSILPGNVVPPADCTAAASGLGGDILIGNFGDGRVNAYRPHGAFRGPLPDSSGQPLTIDGLWSLTFGGASHAEPDTLYFTAGPNGETNGSFGQIVPVGQP